MSVVDAVKSWNQRRQKTVMGGWSLLREQLISGQLDDDGITAAGSLGFAIDQLPELEIQVKQRVTDRKILDGKPALEKQADEIQTEINRHSDAFAKVQEKHRQAIEQLVAEKHTVEFSLAAADDAAKRLRQTVLDPSIDQRHKAINDAIRQLATERSSLAKSAESNRKRFKQAEAELANCEPADQGRYKAIVQQCQSQSAPTLARLAEIEAEVVELHRQAGGIEVEKLLP